MLRTTPCIALLLIAIAGCGGSSSSDHNAEAIESAAQAGEESQAAETEVLKELGKSYSLHHYAGVDNVFELENGELCDIPGVKTADSYPYGVPDDDLESPDGEIVVRVNYFIDVENDTPGEQIRADCLLATKEALGW